MPSTCSHHGCSKVPSYGVDGSSKMEFCYEHKRDRMVDFTSKSRSSGEVRGTSARGRGGGSAADDGGSVEDGDDTATTTITTAVKTEGVALSSSVLFAAAGPVRPGGAAIRHGADGRNKRKARSSPTSGEANAAGSSSSGDHRSCSNTTSRGRAKRARRAAANEDVVMFETDDQPVGASGSATRRRAGVLGPGTKVAVKPEH